MNTDDKIIIDQYLNGQSISALSRDYDLPYCRIQKILKDNNITIRGGRKKVYLTNTEIIIFLKEYKEGKPITQIAQDNNISKRAIENYIEEHKLNRTKKRINKRLRTDYFSKIDSPDKAYWLGFLYTDGSVDHYRSTGRIRLQLQEQDRTILEQYKEDLCLDCSLIEDKRYNSICLSVEFTDEQIYQDLVNFGIIPNKTYESHHIPFEKVPEEYKIDFLRGLFDGDGGLTFSYDDLSDVTLGFTSYYESVVLDFQQEIDKLIGKDVHNKAFFTSAWHVQWRGRQQVIAILDILYNNCTRKLERKYNKYLQLKNSLN